MTTLSSEEINRYSRHLILPEVGPKGQELLKASSVLCIGAGGLGCPLLLYLAAAGVGRIGIVDFDVVDELAASGTVWGIECWSIKSTGCQTEVIGLKSIYQC
jgi:molybdopterin/thiamine biosynthesis adenylyltransferase